MADSERQVHVMVAGSKENRSSRETSHGKRLVSGYVGYHRQHIKCQWGDVVLLQGYNYLGCCWDDIF